MGTASLARPSRWPVVVATALFVLSQAHLIYLVRLLRPNILVLQLTFHSAAYWEILRQWGDLGLRAYQAHFPYDFVHLLVYASFGYVLARHGGLFQSAEARSMRLTAWLLPLAAGFDLVENLLQLYLLGQTPGTASMAVPLSALCSTIKWAGASVFAGTISLKILKKCSQNGRLSH